MLRDIWGGRRKASVRQPAESCEWRGERSISWLEKKKKSVLVTGWNQSRSFIESSLAACLELGLRPQQLLSSGGVHVLK